MGETATQQRWLVVVLGKWNKAILTPLGISRRLLQNPEGTQIQVEVPVDTVGPPRVRHDGIVIAVTDDRLFIEVERDDYGALARATTVAARAVRDLAQTPFS